MPFDFVRGTTCNKAGHNNIGEVGDEFLSNGEGSKMSMVNFIYVLSPLLYATFVIKVQFVLAEMRLRDV